MEPLPTRIEDHCGVYVHRKQDFSWRGDDPADDRGIPFYVGKGKWKRALNLKRTGQHKSVVDKYKDFTIRIEFRSCKSEEEALREEHILISAYKMHKVPIINIMPGGQDVLHLIEARKNSPKINKGATGLKRTREHTEALLEGARKANLGRKLSQEHVDKVRKKLTGRKMGPCSLKTRQKISQSNMGKKIAPEHLAKFLAGAIKKNTGHTLSPEHKEKLRKLHLGRKMSRESKLKLSESKKRAHREKLLLRATAEATVALQIVPLTTDSEQGTSYMKPVKKEPVSTTQDEPKNEVVTVELPEGLNVADLMADAGAGSENVTAQNLAIPIIRILQGNSPQVKRSDPAYVENSREGDLFNNVTNEVYDGEKGITVIPCYFEKSWIEWKINRGGFVKSHPANTPLQNQVRMVADKEGKEQAVLPNGNVLTETDSHFCLLLHENGKLEPAVLAMSSTQLKCSRILNTLINNAQEKIGDGKPFRPARYYWLFKLTTMGKQKDAYSWSTWNIEMAGKNLKHYYEGQALYNAVKAGAVAVKQEPVDEAPATNAPATGAKVEDDEIPF